MRWDDDSAETSGRRIVAAIPARSGSTRLPNKPLQWLGDAPLVVQVWRAVRAAEVADEVVVVTDSAEVEAAIGDAALRVDAPCRSGTERMARALVGVDCRFVINVQGDQPFVGADLLRPLVEALEAGAEIATLSAPLEPGDRAEPSRVKVVCDRRGRALYFSRQAIPGDLHVGIYGFRAAVLPRLLDLPRSPLAQAEDLEQLDWLHAGLSITVVPVARAPLSIDTPSDLEAARRLFRTNNPAKRGA